MGDLIAGRSPLWQTRSGRVPVRRARVTGAHYLFASSKVPNEASALAASRHYSAKPHIAGSEQDFQTAKDLLSHIRAEFDIPLSDAIFDAGSLESREATLSIANRTEPYAWIDTYYPLLNLPLNRSLEILDENGTAIWSADLSEQGLSAAPLTE